MALVDYSDSEESGGEDAPPLKGFPSTTKPTVQRIVDRSNPGKILVSLPKASPDDEAKLDEPPSKRVKTGGGTFGGLASFLPPPKKTGIIRKGALASSGPRRGGLGAGVSLKTGAAPGFSREPKPERESEPREALVDDDDGESSRQTGLQLPPPKANAQPKPEEVKLVGKPLMFKPLSVSRKPVKKKKQQTSDGSSTTVTSTANNQAKELSNQATEIPPRRQKLSLFSMHTESSDAPSIPTSNIYEPYEAPSQETSESSAYTNDGYTVSTTNATPAPPTATSSQSLDDIASDLNLSASDRRQLFGRQRPGSNNSSSFQAAKIVNFNMDKEYAHNEELRAAGEEVVHNPVRAIAPGKHSLRQLVNAAQSQKEALEESFAKGKTNRAEASSRYGW